METSVFPAIEVEEEFVYGVQDEDRSNNKDPLPNAKTDTDSFVANNQPHDKPDEAGFLPWPNAVSYDSMKYTCTLCSKKFYSRNGRYYHNKTYHPEIIGRPRGATKNFWKKNNQPEVREEPSKSVQDTIQDTVICATDVLQMSDFTQMESLHQQGITSYIDISSDSASSMADEKQLEDSLPSSLPENAPSDKSAAYYCQLCSVVFVSRKTLYQHNKKFHPELVLKLRNRSKPKQAMASTPESSKTANDESNDIDWLLPAGDKSCQADFFLDDIDAMSRCEILKLRERLDVLTKEKSQLADHVKHLVGQYSKLWDVTMSQEKLTKELDQLRAENYRLKGHLIELSSPDQVCFQKDNTNTSNSLLTEKKPWKAKQVIGPSLNGT